MDELMELIEILRRKFLEVNCVLYVNLVLLWERQRSFFEDFVNVYGLSFFFVLNEIMRKDKFFYVNIS